MLEPIPPLGVSPKPPALFGGPESLPADDDRTILFGAGAVVVAWEAFAAEIVGKPDPVVSALALIAFGGGTKVEEAGFDGSS